MAVYIYEGKTLNGSVIKGKLEADDKNLVKSSLRAKGIFPTAIREETIGTEISFSFKNGIPYKELAVFCRQMHFSLAAGIPMLRTLGMIKDQIQHKKLKSILKNVYEEVQKGSTFSSILKQHKDIPSMLSSMVEVGEATGKIDEIMGEMAEYYDKQHRQQKKINNALTYPKFLLGFAILVVIGLVTFVVPTFVDGILSAGQELPVPTKIIIAISDFVKSNFILLTLIIIGLILFKILVIDKNEAIQFLIDKFLVKSKYVAVISQQIFSARFARTFAILVKGGMSVIEALTIAGNVVDNSYIKKSIEESMTLIRTGGAIGESLESKSIFPVLLTQMIKVGEETGEIDDILKKTAEYYEIEAELALQKLTSLIEPLMIVFLSFIVGFVVISLAMPMFQIMGTV